MRYTLINFKLILNFTISNSMLCMYDLIVYFVRNYFIKNYKIISILLNNISEINSLIIISYFLIMCEEIIKKILLYLIDKYWFESWNAHIENKANFKIM